MVNLMNNFLFPICTLSLRKNLNFTTLDVKRVNANFIFSISHFNRFIKKHLEKVDVEE